MKCTWNMKFSTVSFLFNIASSATLLSRSRAFLRSAKYKSESDHKKKPPGFQKRPTNTRANLRSEFSTVTCSSSVFTRASKVRLSS